jgi:hypothetical protein
MDAVVAAEASVMRNVFHSSRSSGATHNAHPALTRPMFTQGHSMNYGVVCGYLRASFDTSR